MKKAKEECNKCGCKFEHTSLNIREEVTNLINCLGFFRYCNNIEGNYNGTS